MMPGAALLVALLSQSSSDLRAGTGGAGSARLRLEVGGDAGCVSRAELTARIAARSARIDVTDDATLLARVVVGRSPTGRVAGDLFLGRDPPRRVAGRSCSEVADGLGLIIAVTLDPSLRPPAQAGAPSHASAAAGQSDQPRSPPPTPPVSTTRAGTSPTERPASAARPTPPETSDRRATPPAPAATVPRVTRAASPGREVGAILAGQAIFGPAPAAMPGVTLYVMGAIERDGPWAPALVLGATHAWRSDLAEQGGTASFVLDAASVDACPLRVRRFGVTARPCLAVLVGRFVAQGANTDRPQTVPRPFAATGGALTASAGSTVQLFGRFGLGVTVVRDAYEFATDVFHRASLFMFSASIGVGARWR